MVDQVIENLDILFNITGQSLVFDCPEGRPSSVVASQVFEAIGSDDGAEEDALSGSAAVETNPNTTFDADSGSSEADPTLCNLTATTGIAKGRVYLATTATGESEWVEVVEITSAASVRARQPLINAYASADTFQSTRITHAIDSTWIADKTNISDLNDPSPLYRWRLVYVVGGVTYAQHVFFDVVRYSPGTTVTGLDVDRENPGWLNRLPTHYREDQGATLIQAAYRGVKMDMYQTGKADQMARNRELVDDLVLNKALYLGVRAALAAGAAEPVAVLEAKEAYMERFNNFLVTPKLKFDHGGAGAALPAQSAPLWRR